MAQNLRAKIPESDTLIIHDRNRELSQKFKEEVGIAAAGAGAKGKANAIEVSDSPRELAEKSVRTIQNRSVLLPPNDEHVPHE